MRSCFLLFTCIIIAGLLRAQTTDICVTKDEQQLYKLIMDYRATYKLPNIPLSKSLSYVAHQHAWDLAVNQPSGGNCNMHSWSDKGKWSSCCYTSDHKQAKCMWTKPQELTTYPGYGFEISCGGSAALSPSEALACWQGSEHHNNVILNKDIWKDYTWKSIGISIYGNYAVVWFGKEEDPEGDAPKCN